MYYICPKELNSPGYESKSERMSFRSLTVALELYRSGTLALDEAADRGNVSPAKLAAEARARGIQVGENRPEKAHYREQQ